MFTSLIYFKFAISLSSAFIRSQVESNEEECKQRRLTDSNPDVAHRVASGDGAIHNCKDYKDEKLNNLQLSQVLLPPKIRTQLWND